jgi:hypothetical protein
MNDGIILQKIKSKNEINILWALNDCQENNKYLTYMRSEYGTQNIKLFNSREVEEITLYYKEGIHYYIIVSGNNFDQIKNFFDMQELLGIFVFCYDILKYENLKKEFKKIISIENSFNLIENALQKIRKGFLIPFNEEINVIKKIKSGHLINETQSFIDYILLNTVNKLIERKNMLNQNYAKKHLLNFCYSYINNKKSSPEEHNRDKIILSNFIESVNTDINGFFINWYTKETFFYKMINDCFRDNNYLHLFYINILFVI